MLHSILCFFVYASIKLDQYEPGVWATKPPAPLIVGFAESQPDAEKHANYLDQYMKGSLHSQVVSKSFGLQTFDWAEGKGGFFKHASNLCSFISARTLAELQASWTSTLKYFAEKYTKISTKQQTPARLMQSASTLTPQPTITPQEQAVRRVNTFAQTTLGSDPAKTKRLEKMFRAVYSGSSQQRLQDIFTEAPPAYANHAMKGMLDFEEKYTEKKTAQNEIDEIIEEIRTLILKNNSLLVFSHKLIRFWHPQISSDEISRFETHVFDRVRQSGKTAGAIVAVLTQIESEKSQENIKKLVETFLLS